MKTRPGDRVRYINFDGVEAEVVVLHPIMDVRDKVPGFIGHDPITGENRWGYDAQILSINGEEVG
jgi:hypothetical protein